MSSGDIERLRDLTKRYLEICHTDEQQRRRDLWRRHNSLQYTRPPIYVRAFAWREMPECRSTCQDPFYRPYEDVLRQSLFRATFDDDFVFEPWVMVRAAVITPPEGLWGLPVLWSDPSDPRGSRAMIPTIVSPEDAQRMVAPHHSIDEGETERRASRLADAIGDLITIEVDRKPAYHMWGGDISTQIARLRGLDQLMLDMIDRPEWLHQVLAFMRDGIIRTHEEAEGAGDWSLASHQNQAMPYSLELDDPAPNSPGVTRDRLWYFCASQETTLVGPRMFDEFMLQYQIPIMAPFGLTAYGCCEDLTHKISLLRQIPNLRRIAVAPAANVAACAEQIGTDYVFSYRPSPTDHVGYGFDPERVRAMLREDLMACRHCHVDVTLKDVETVQGDRDRVRTWVRVCREVIDEVFG